VILTIGSEEAQNVLREMVPLVEVLGLEDIVVQ
jgi:hypothetical protein